MYSTKNLVEIGVIRELVSYRVPHEFIHSVMTELKKIRLSEDNGFNVIVVLSRQLLGGGREVSGFVHDIRVGTRKGFSKQAGELIFGEKLVPSKPGFGKAFQRTMMVGSAIVVSLADIWEYIQKNL